MRGSAPRAWILIAALAGCAPTAPPASVPPDGRSTPTPAPTPVPPDVGPRWSPFPIDLPAPPPPTVFADVTELLGVDAPHRGLHDPRRTEWMTGQGWADLDRDGRLDLVVTDPFGNNRIFLQRADGSFERLDPCGLEGVPGMGLSLADLDNDGDVDVFLSSYDPDLIGLNDGTGRFALSDGGGAFQRKAAGVASAWADYDGDGVLDVYATNYLCSQCGEPALSEAERAADDLWHGLGGGAFEHRNDLFDDPQLLGALSMQPAWFDFDDDGDLDLYVVVDRGLPGDPEPGAVTRRNVLWRDDGPGCGGWCFTEVAQDVGLDNRIDGMCAAVGDYDNDGDLDLFMTDTDRGYLMRNEGGFFVDATLAAGLDRPMIGWGCAWLDYDNDGWLDLYAAAGAGQTDGLWRNRGDGTFSDERDQTGAGYIGNTAGLAAADFDGDGDVDLVLAAIGDSYRVHRNRLRTGHGWLGLRLIGDGPGGRDAVGATVYVTTDDGMVQRRDVRIGSSLGAGDDTGLHFGLGDRTIVSVRVIWPDGSEGSISPPVGTWSMVLKKPD